MKANEVSFLIAIAAFVIGCSSDKQIKDGLPCINVKKNYPVKEIILTDIADVTYVHLSTENADYLYRGRINYVTENTIVVIDYTSGSILFFSKDGKPKSRFNRYGNRPEEYSTMMFFIVYDESADDVFVYIPFTFSISGHSILVYSSTGEYKRKLPLSASALPLVDFDSQSLFLYSLQNQSRKMRKETDFFSQSVDSSYYRISKTDGKVLEYVEFPGNAIDLTDRGGSDRRIEGHIRIVNCTAGLFLCNPETDTVFLYGKDKTLTPIICKTPLVSDLNPKVILNDFVDAGRYQFIGVSTLFNSDDEIMKIPLNERYDYLNKHYIYDKQTGKIFRQKISVSDYKGKDFFITAQKTHFNGKKMLAHFELDLFELKQASRENKLSGKLKELVATLNENEDNNVFMLVNFK